MRAPQSHQWLRLRHSRGVRFAGAIAGLPSYALWKMHNKNQLKVDLYEPIGIGATLSKALLFYAHAERHDLEQSIISSNPLYASADFADFLPTFFNRVRADSTGMLRGRSFQAAARLLIRTHISLFEVVPVPGTVWRQGQDGFRV